MRALTLAILFLTALLAGCAGGPGTITMREGLADARAAAQDWGDNVELAGALAIEPFKRAEDRDDDGTLRGEFVTHLDSDPGDGRAPGWLYAFTADDGRCIFVALAAGLGVLAEGWEECDAVGDQASPLPDGVLDSDSVASILSDLEGWPRRDDATTATWALGMEDGSAYWAVTSSNQTSYAMAVVDALTGNATLVDSGRQGEFMVDGEETAPTSTGDSHVSGSGQVVTVATPFSLTIDVGGDGAVMLITASMQTSLVGQGDLLVIDEGGATVFQDSFSGQKDFEVHDVAAGTYELRIEHGNAALNPAIEAYAFW